MLSNKDKECSQSDMDAGESSPNSSVQLLSREHGQPAMHMHLALLVVTSLHFTPCAWFIYPLANHMGWLALIDENKINATVSFSKRKGGILYIRHQNDAI